jgi:hypothetical protein
VALVFYLSGCQLVHRLSAKTEAERVLQSCGEDGSRDADAFSSRAAGSMKQVSEMLRDDAAMLAAYYPSGESVEKVVAVPVSPRPTVTKRKPEIGPGSGQFIERGKLTGVPSWQCEKVSSIHSSHSFNFINNPMLSTKPKPSPKRKCLSAFAHRLTKVKVGEEASTGTQRALEDSSDLQGGRGFQVAHTRNDPSCICSSHTLPFNCGMLLRVIR